MQRPSRWEHDVFINHFQICLSSTTVTSSQRLVLFPSSPEETDRFKLHIYCGWNDAKEERLEKHSQRRRIPGENHEENLKRCQKNLLQHTLHPDNVVPGFTSWNVNFKVNFNFNKVALPFPEHQTSKTPLPNTAQLC